METALLSAADQPKQTAEEEVGTSPPAPPAPPYSHRRSLYVSYFFAAFGDRMWEFASLVFLMSLFPSSLLAASLLGLLETAAAIVCSPALGRYIDRTSRLRAVCWSIMGQNVAVSAGGVMLFYLLHGAAAGWLTERGRWIGWAALSMAAMAARVASSLNKLSIHKSWLPVLAASSHEPHCHSRSHEPVQPSSALLSSLNGVMRGIDLSSSIVAPLLVGVLGSLWDEMVASLFVSGWSTLSLLLECYLVRRVWDKVPQLQHKPRSNAAMGQSTVGWWDAARQYWNHPLFSPSLAYCLLYISVLSFGGIMTSYLASDLVQLSDALLAVGRASAAVVGLMATLSTPHLIPRFGLVRSGSALIVLQCGCLSSVVAAFALPSLGRSLFLVLVFVGLCSSRYGLWGFDLVLTQQLQEGVAETVVGAVNGMQESLMNACFMLSFVLTLLFADPNEFVWPVWISFGSVVLAAIIYLRWALLQPG